MIMDEISGTITLCLVAAGSKSEGRQALLRCDDGCKYNLYRKDMLPVNDPFFAPYDNRHVTVKGTVEQSSEHTSICVASLVFDDGTELVPQKEEQLFSGSLFITDDAPKSTAGPKRLPRKLKKLIKKQLKDNTL